MCQWPFSRNILSAFDVQYQPVTSMHSFGPFWTTLMPREFILSRKLDIGPFECSSLCSNLQPDSPPPRVPGQDRSPFVIPFSAVHCFCQSDLSIMQSVGHRTTVHFDLVTFRLAVSRHVHSSSRCQTFVTSLPKSIRDSAADTSRFTGPFRENPRVVSVSFIMQMQ